MTIDWTVADGTPIELLSAVVGSERALFDGLPNHNCQPFSGSEYEAFKSVVEEQEAKFTTFTAFEGCVLMLHLQSPKISAWLVQTNGKISLTFAFEDVNRFFQIFDSFHAALMSLADGLLPLRRALIGASATRSRVTVH